MKISETAKGEAFRRRVARYAAARDLALVARENVKALEAKLAKAQREAAQAEMLRSKAMSRAYRAHVALDRRTRFVGQVSARLAEINQIADVMRDSAEVNQALVALARETA